MTEKAMKGVLMQMKKGEVRDERWFLFHTECTKEDLKRMVSLGYLVRTDKDTDDFMSDNCYELTAAGYKFAWE